MVGQRLEPSLTVDVSALRITRHRSGFDCANPAASVFAAFRRRIYAPGQTRRDRSNIAVERFFDIPRRIAQERVPTASNVGSRDVTWASQATALIPLSRLFAAPFLRQSGDTYMAETQFLIGLRVLCGLLCVCSSSKQELAYSTLRDTHDALRKGKGWSLRLPRLGQTRRDRSNIAVERFFVFSTFHAGSRRSASLPRPMSGRAM